MGTYLGFFLGPDDVGLWRFLSDDVKVALGEQFLTGEWSDAQNYNGHVTTPAASHGSGCAGHLLTSTPPSDWLFSSSTSTPKTLDENNHLAWTRHVYCKTQDIAHQTQQKKIQHTVWPYKYIWAGEKDWHDNKIALLQKTNTPTLSAKWWMMDGTVINQEGQSDEIMSSFWPQT